MKTLKKIPVTVKHVTIIDSQLEQNIIYISDKFKLSVHLCLCGCGNKAVTPINKDGWLVTENEKGVTFKPSILNTNCPNRYHYIITNGIANVV